MEQAEQGSNKDQTMNHEQSKRVITEYHHSGPPIDMAKKDRLPSEAAASMQGSPGSDEK